MEIGSREVNDVRVVTLTGDLDGRTAPGAQDELLPLLVPDGSVLLDLSGVEYMSSAGLRMMLLVYRHAQSAACRIALVGLSEDIQDTMSATGFLDYFLLSDDVDAGVAALAR